MQLEVIIQALRERCPSFANRFAGAAGFKILPESAALPVPCAYVIPLDDNPDGAGAKNNVRQTLADSFAVIIAVSNCRDERGQKAAHDIHALRAELWSALLGWRPSAEYDGIVYEGGNLLSLDRARLWYQFEFSASMEIDGSDGWQDTELAGLPHFDGVNFKSDFIDPADPNKAYPGPDGRIEVEFSAPAKSGNLP